MDIQRALDMRELGIPWNEIAEELGVPLHTVRYNCDLAGVERRHYKGVDLEAVERMRSQGLPWAAIECATGYHQKHLQKLLRDKPC